MQTYTDRHMNINTDTDTYTNTQCIVHRWTDRQRDKQRDRQTCVSMTLISIQG